MMLASWLTFSGFGSQASAQDTSYQLITEIKTSVEYFTTDALKNVYIFNSDNILQKYNVKGELLFEYDQQNYGTASYIDASNPLRILVYYEEYLTATVLDRTLSELYVFNLKDYDIFQAQAITGANDNGIWFYDEWSFQLKKISQQGKIERTSDDFSQIFSEEILPKQLLLSGNRIYINSPKVGVLVFNFFGKYIQTIPLLIEKTLQIQNNQIIYFEGDELHAYSLQSFQKAIINIQKNVKNVQVVQQYLFLEMDGKVMIYSK
jgi:hypothetical protein